MDLAAAHADVVDPANPTTDEMAAIATAQLAVDYVQNDVDAAQTDVDSQQSTVDDTNASLNVINSALTSGLRLELDSTANVTVKIVGESATYSSGIIDIGSGNTATGVVIPLPNINPTIFTVRVTGNVKSFKFNSAINSYPAKTVQSLLSFPENLESFRLMGCSNLTSVPAVLPATVTSLESAFQGCSSFNQDISLWDTSSVTNMYKTFSIAASFNQPIGSWNTSNVTNMGQMFLEASSFNQDLSTWITGLTTQPFYFSSSANPTWIANNATRFPFLSDGVTRINT